MRMRISCWKIEYMKGTRAIMASFLLAERVPWEKFDAWLDRTEVWA